jgi:hypothetical protein
LVFPGAALFEAPFVQDVTSETNAISIIIVKSLRSILWNMHPVRKSRTMWLHQVGNAKTELSFSKLSN